MIESLFAIMVLALVFFTALEMSQLFAGAEIMDHAANAGVRAKAVGFNDFMVEKVVRVASIPNAGNMVHPILDIIPASRPVAYYRDTPIHRQWEAALASDSTAPHVALEASRIPLYLGAQRRGELDAILDYEDWDSVHYPDELNNGGRTVAVKTGQGKPLKFPFHDWFYASDTFPLRGEAWHADHYSLYLE